MKEKQVKFKVVGSFCFLVLFIAYTVLLMSIDKRAIGPENSWVGFATINAYVHNLFGVNMALYQFTDWLGILVILIMGGFALVGFVQLIKRKSLKLVDQSILLLGMYYLLVFSFYLFFEFFVVNYRPVLIEGVLEASYPSSTTMLALCIIPVTIIQLKDIVSNNTARYILNAMSILFLSTMVIGRILSGVHWFTDILGGVILSVALVMLYSALHQLIIKKDL